MEKLLEKMDLSRTKKRWEMGIVWGRSSLSRIKVLSIIKGGDLGRSLQESKQESRQWKIKKDDGKSNRIKTMTRRSKAMMKC